MSINKFITNLDLSRQAEILSGETAVFQGGIELGIPFSGFPSGVDTSTIVSLGVQEIEYTAFSGGSGTTLFDVVNPSSPYYSVSAATLSASPYTIIDVNTITETVSATTYPTIMTFTALSGDCCSTPISVSFTPPIIQELYDRGLYDGLFNGLRQATIGTTYIDESFYNVGSVFSGANLDMEIIEYGVHGSNPSWSTGTTSGTVIEYSALTQYWVDPIYENLTSGLTLPISPISAETQTSDYVWTLTDSTIIDDNLIGLQYTGYNVTYSFDNVIDDPATQTYIIGGVTATLEYFSAGTLDYKNSIEWLKVRGNATIDERLTTDRLTIHTLGTGSSVTMLGVDVNGNVVGGSGFTGYWELDTTNQNSITTNFNGNSILSTEYGFMVGRLNTLKGANYSSILGGVSNNIENATSSMIMASSSNITSNANFGVILGGSVNNMETVDFGFILGGNQNTNTGQNYSGIVGGWKNTIEGATSSGVILGGTNNSLGGLVNSYNTIIGGYNNNISGTTAVVGNSIIGGNGNTIEGDLDNIIILGGVGVTATQEDTTYVDNLNINTLGGGTSVNNLGIDSNGNVVTGTTGGGSTTSSYWTSGSSGNYSIKVINDSTTDATGDYAVAEGINTLASGSYSHAEGIGTTASGIKGSHAEGNGTVASGAVSHSQNSNTIAAGNGSHAGGAYSTASGDTSFIHSTNSLVTGDRSVVLGGQNITGTTDDTVYMNKLYVTDPSEGNFYTSLDNAAGAQTVLSGTSDSLSRMSVISPNVGGIGLGVRGESETTYSGYGKQGDGYIYSTTGNNGINIISAPGSATDDYIRFYAGKGANGTTSDIHIQGTGITQGYVGIGTDTPTEKLDVNGNTIVSGTLNIGTLGGGSSVNNLGIDASGNVVSANTGSFLAAKSPEAIVTHSLTAKGIPDGQVISGYTSIFYNNTDISGTLTTPFGTFDNTTGLFTTNTDCVLNIQAYIHLKANTSSTTAWETGATPTQIGLGICPNNTTDVYVGDFLTILPSVSRGLDITTGITLRVLSGTTFRVKVLNQTSRAYPGAGVVSGDYMRFSITRVD